jgi:hypothetical protein
MSLIAKINTLTALYLDHGDSCSFEVSEEVTALEEEVEQLVAALESENAVLRDALRQIKAGLTILDSKTHSSWLS